MSQFDLSEPTYRRLPAYPRPEMSLVLIQTQRFDYECNNLPQPMEDPEEMELSLEQHLLRDAVQSSSSIKKKKSGCTCKKTKCLKMYCECFSSGRQCTDDCNCQGCSNCQEHLDSILKAQEIAKVKEQSKSSRKGCNCRKTHCQKKYCQCFNLGLPCNQNCKCLGCENLQAKQKVSNESKETIYCKIAESFID